MVASKTKIKPGAVVHDSAHKNKHTSKSGRTKTAKIKYHHKKTYRKRYFGAAVFFIAGAILLLAYVMAYSISTKINLDNARNYVNESLPKSGNDSSDNTVANKISIHSTYGFGLAFSQDKYYATALDKNSGQLFLGAELAPNRAYNAIRISPVWVDEKDNNVSLSMEYKDDVIIQNLDQKTVTSIEQSLASSGVEKKAVANRVSTKKQTIGGQEFIVSDWERQTNTSIGANFTAYFTTMLGLVDGHPFVIMVNKGFSKSNAENDIFQDLLESMYFGNRTQARAVPFAAPKGVEYSSLDVINKITFTDLASAADQQVPLSEVNSAKFSPSVVKIYSVYCADILVKSKPFVRDYCEGSAGSGFFIDRKGHIATNGHVVPPSSKDIAITSAFKKLYRNDDSYFTLLVSMTGITEADIAGITDENDLAQFVIDKMYDLDDSLFTMENDAINLLVCLNDKQPDVKELKSLTQKRQKYPEQDSIKAASVLGEDYRTIDGVTAFRASDVAVIKIEGDNYPTVGLGSIDSVTQGANLSILGFPGQAVDNDIIGEGDSKVTLTSGKVSSLKNAKGSDKRLIETDATIGHGNSGGPVLGDDGKVIGIATYTVDGSGKGDGVFNYIRDVKDLKDLIESKSIELSTDENKTQDEWERGLELFYEARYSKSIKNFDKVKELYPQHPKVGEFVATAQQRIKDGQDVKDFPVVIVAAVAVVVVGGILVTVLLMIRHKKTHNVYKAQVSTGAMQPLQPGSPVQRVEYNPAEVRAINNPLNVPPTPVAAPMMVQQPPTVAAPQPAFPGQMQQQAYPSNPPAVIQPSSMPNIPPNNGVVSEPPQVIEPQNQQQPPTAAI